MNLGRQPNRYAPETRYAINVGQHSLGYVLVLGTVSFNPLLDPNIFKLIGGKWKMESKLISSPGSPDDSLDLANPRIPPRTRERTETILVYFRNSA